MRTGLKLERENHKRKAENHNFISVINTVIMGLVDKSNVQMTIGRMSYFVNKGMS